MVSLSYSSIRFPLNRGPPVIEQDSWSGLLLRHGSDVVGLIRLHFILHIICMDLASDPVY